jgi:hypothetical protein
VTSKTWGITSRAAIRCDVDPRAPPDRSDFVLPVFIYLALHVRFVLFLRSVFGRGSARFSSFFSPLRLGSWRGTRCARSAHGHMIRIAASNSKLTTSTPGLLSAAGGDFRLYKTTAIRRRSWINTTHKPLNLIGPHNTALPLLGPVPFRSRPCSCCELLAVAQTSHAHMGYPCPALPNTRRGWATFPARERGSAAGSLLSSHCPKCAWACVLCGLPIPWCRCQQQQCAHLGPPARGLGAAGRLSGQLRPTALSCWSSPSFSRKRVLPGSWH